MKKYMVLQQLLFTSILMIKSFTKIGIMKFTSMKCFLLFIFLSTLVYAQSSDNEKDTLIIAGKEYSSNWFHNFFFGEHWRDVWTTPVKVKVLDINSFAGGLTPIKRGGGFQTKSLRFKGNDNHYWKFRSIGKDPSKTLPEDLRESFADDILQDQISSSYPYGAFVVAPILDSLDVLQARPFLYYLPDVEGLGLFREEFGNMLGILEVHPDVEEKDKIYFEDADKIKGTLKLFERLEEKTDEYVNSQEYLKVRLIDILLGDWDRHADQWKWARYRDGNKKVWHPIPRDRDQVFAKFDGMLPRLAEYLLPQFNSFEDSYNNIEHLTWNGRFVDQHFLIQITKDDWDSVTTLVQSKFTDSLIASAVKELPPEIYSISASEIVRKLKDRRDKLHEVSEEYYQFTNTVVDVYGSQKNDYVEINRVGDDQTKLKLFKNTKRKDRSNSLPFFEKTFDNNITDEIRIYLYDGDDTVKLFGTADDGTLVRIISGKGKDTIIDSSRVNGYFLSVTPFPNAKNKTKIYDSGKKTKIVYGPGTTYDDEKVSVPDSLEERYRPLQRDRSSELLFFPIINYSSDNGFIIGGGSLFYQYGFRAIPNKNNYSLTAQYATEPNNGRVHFRSTFNSIFRNISLNFDADFDGLLFTTYYGFGNETEFSTELEREDFYRLEQRLISIKPSLEYAISSRANLLFGISYLYSNSDLKNRSLLESFPEGEYGLGKLSTFRSNIDLTYDSRDKELFAESGFYAFGSAYLFPKLLDNKEHFGGTIIDLRTYFTTSFITKTTFEFRVSGKKVWGQYPFLTAAFLGGANNLLGYRRERFSGDASIYGRMLLRIQLSKIRLLINGTMGIHGYLETGRVYTDTIYSKIWHSGFGGGLWLSYLNRALNLVVTIAKSEESYRFYFSTGFTF